ncbi:MAG: NUDIX hydrolase [Candidatus Doudnabacteria bacterium]|nr:NUDIX hydrolase [Candidatus Doudnabacteria bacterium]
MLIKRSRREKNYPGFWAFPGGKVEIGETIIDTMKREVAEETGLRLKPRLILLDSYAFKRSVGLGILVLSWSNRVKLAPREASEYAWVKTLKNVKKYRRVPGIDNHLQRAKAELRRPRWQNFNALDLSAGRFLNR